MYKFVLILSQCCACESGSVHSIERRNCCGKTFVLGNNISTSDGKIYTMEIHEHLMTMVHTGMTCTGNGMICLDAMHEYT